MKSNTVSIGYQREDGDFAILATLNNNDEHMDEKQFDNLIASTVAMIEDATGMIREEIMVLNRQDAPDYVDTEETDSFYE